MFALVLDGFWPLGKIVFVKFDCKNTPTMENSKTTSQYPGQ